MAQVEGSGTAGFTDDNENACELLAVFSTAKKSAPTLLKLPDGRLLFAQTKFSCPRSETEK